MTVFLLGLAFPLLLGYCLLRLLLPRLGPALHVSLGAGLGAGILSCGYFVSLLTGLPPLLSEGLAVVLAVGLHTQRSPLDSTPLNPWTLSEKLLGTVLAISSTAALAAFLSTLNSQPYGGWDGWAIWNTRADFLATTSWRNGFSPFLLYSHPDYPLLLPGLIARAWRLTGVRDIVAPAVAAGLFTAATIGLLFGSLAALKGRAQGFLAAILLTATRFFAIHGASEYADVPLSFFVLATIALFALSNRQPAPATPASQTWPPVLSGLAMGFAVWTKNEGWLLVAALLTVCGLHLAYCALHRLATCRACFRSAALAAAGFAPPGFITLYFKYSLATPNDMLGHRSFDSLIDVFTSPDRYQALAYGLLSLLSSAGDTGFLIPVLGVFLYALFARRAAGTLAPPARSTNRFCFAVLVIAFAGYCATLILSPWEIHYQLETALDRLMLQLLPAGLFTAFLALPSLGESVTGPAPE